MTKLNPVDGLPEWPGRQVETELTRRRRAKRARRFVMIEWGDLISGLPALNRPARLFLLLHLYIRLQKAKAKHGWVELVRHDLEELGLVDSNLTKAVATLERRDLIEVQRRPGKRPLLRLINWRAIDDHSLD